MRRIRECHDGLFESELTHRVIGTFYDVYNTLGYGFLESVYARSMVLELTRRGFEVATQASAEVRYQGDIVGTFRADIIVESRLVLELKAARSLTPADEMQVLNYLRATDLELGLVAPFRSQASLSPVRLDPNGRVRTIRVHPRHPRPRQFPQFPPVSAVSAVTAHPASAAIRPITSPTPASSSPHPPPRSAAYPTP